MSNDKKAPEQPSQPTKPPAHDSNTGNRSGSVDFAEGYRQLNEVLNTLPPPAPKQGK